jgi:tripartite-type tricarboxylate transporter receptor subunit TctC
LKTSPEGSLDSVYRRTLLSGLGGLAGVALGAFAPWASWANEPAWPSRPITLVVADGPGGVLDVRTRWLAERLARELGQPVIVDNRPIAGGRTAMQSVARSAPDGYTLVATNMAGLVFSQFMIDKLGYDPIKDFVPITRHGVGSFVLVVGADSPFKSLADLVAAAKARPGALSFSTPGIGTPPHVALEFFKRSAAIDALAVHYRSGPQFIIDVIGGQVNFSMSGVAGVAPHVRSGRLRALAFTGRERSPQFPELPTVAESGYPQYVAYGWTAIAAPAGTPKPVIDRIYAAALKAMSSAEGQKLLADLSLEPGMETPEAFAALIRAEAAQWGAVIKAANIKAE